MAASDATICQKRQLAGRGFVIERLSSDKEEKPLLLQQERLTSTLKTLLRS
jgi:hypothetical protein